MEKTDTHPRPRFASKLLKTLVIFGLVLLGMHLLLQALNLLVYYQQHGQFYELSNRFDFDDEASVPTWFSQFLFLLLAAGAASAAFLERERKVRRIWAVIATAGFIFSIDEVATLHEFALQTLHVIFYQDAGPGSLSNAWLLVAPFIVLIAVFFIASMVRHFPKRTIYLFSSSVVVFLVGAIGVDLFTSLVERESFMNQGVLVGIEESLELFSLIIINYAVADYIERRHSPAIRSAWRHLRS